jgi:hypothetical protein
VTPWWPKRFFCGLEFVPGQSTLQLPKHIKVRERQLQAVRRMIDQTDSGLLETCDRFPGSARGGVVHVQH